MSKIAFVGFGEVNSPIDIIVNKCKAAEESLVKEGVVEVMLLGQNVNSYGKDMDFEYDFGSRKKRAFR